MHTTFIQVVVAFLSVNVMCAALCHAQVVIQGGGSQNKAPQDSTQRALAALDLAVLAAESGVEDVAFEAVRRAVSDGPPVAAVDLGGLLSPAQRRTTIYSSSGVGAEQNNNQGEVAKRLAKVDAVWKKTNADPQTCFDLWKELVFPAARPSEAFSYSAVLQNNSISYSVNLTESEPEPIPCGAEFLIQWARAAQRVDDLKATMQERAKMPAAQSTVNLLRIMLAEDDPAEAAALCDELSQNPKLLVDDRDAQLLCSVAYKMLLSMPADSEARDKLWTAILQTIATTERWAANSWLRYAILNETKMAIEQGNQTRFDEFATAALSVLAPLSSGNEDYKAQMTSSFYAAGAEAAFKSQHLQMGLECLKRQTFSVSGSHGTASGSRLVRPNSQITQQLLKLTPQQRYDALFELAWSMPMLGLEQAAAVAPRDEIPPQFITSYQNYRKTDTLPLEQITSRDSYSFSLLEWMMRDALRIGKLDAVRAKLQELEDKKSDDLILAKIVLAKVQGEDLDFDLIRSNNADGKPVLRSEVAGRGSLLPLDMEIAWRAMQNEATRMEGLDLAERLAQRALENRGIDVLQGRWLAALARLGSGDPPATSDQLLHFVEANEFTGNDVQLGKPLGSIWLEKSPGEWEHQACGGRSLLLMKYPLAGKFDIQFECMDTAYGEGGSTLAGITMDFRGYLKDVGFYAIGNRTSRILPNEHVKGNEFNAYTLRRDTQAGTLSLICEGKEVGTLFIAADEFPFYGLQTQQHRKMSTKDLQITGDITIPRSLELVTPQLLGWSAVFKGKKMPGTEFLPGETDVTGSSPEERDEATADVDYDWHFVDGCIESVDHAGLREIDRQAGKKVEEPKFPPREEWLYYLRPLCDGEQVAFEFYHDADKYSLSPTIDRIAVLLDQPQIQQHWITCDSGNWFGVNSTNHCNAPPQHVLAAVHLKESQWNAASLRRTGDNIVLSINGQDIYQQTADKQTGGRFGIFHDSTKFQVRVRNVVLTGDWPESLPTNLFEMN